VPADELLVHLPCHLLEIARALLFEQEREDVHLEEQVAELVAQLRPVALKRRVRHLVGLLDRVWNDRPCCLFPVPGTVAT
jgi:hypothetical protein